MIYDVRTYDLAPQKLKAYVDVYRTFAMPVAERHGLRLAAVLTSRIGRLNQVVHIWEYDDLADMERRRAARDADPGWAEYRNAAAGMIVAQEDKIMDGAPFSPLR
jgi:hypothetical protein